MYALVTPDLMLGIGLLFLALFLLSGIKIVREWERAPVLSWAGTWASRGPA